MEKGQESHIHTYTHIHTHSHTHMCRFNRFFMEQEEEAVIQLQSLTDELDEQQGAVTSIQLKERLVQVCVRVCMCVCVCVCVLVCVGVGAGVRTLVLSLRLAVGVCGWIVKMCAYIHVIVCACMAMIPCLVLLRNWVEWQACERILLERGVGQNHPSIVWTSYWKR